MMNDGDTTMLHGAVLSASSDYRDILVQNDLSLSPFKFVLLFNNGEEDLLCARVYESESGHWSSISPIAVGNEPNGFSSSVMVRNALYWFHWGCESDIIGFDLGAHSLAKFQIPENAHFTEESRFQLLRTEDRGLCLAIGSPLRGLL